ncbi:MAG: adenylate/guanylate cyclase domain-containing protein [Solirubrobacterales bacterium]|nr:adenylate/guanylate cyclase domain-containing protein [Solirubrobacterales bacterium]
MPDSAEREGGSPDFDAEGLLDGLEGEEREARLRLLEYLWREEGVELEMLRREVDAQRLALLPADLAIGRRTERFTPAEVAEDAGITVAQLQRLIAALGFPPPAPDQRTLGRDEIHAAKRLRKFMDAGIPFDNMIAVTRVVGSSAARIAQVHRDLVATDIVDPEADEYETAIRLRDAAEELMPMGDAAVTYALRSHFVDQLRSQVIAMGAPGWFGSSTEVEVSVCFADLVGFTRLGERSELEEIGSVAKLLESVAIEVTNPEVRLVKLIGDAAMLVSEDGAALFDAALRFIEVGRDSGSELPALRVGVARGTAIPQVGDWFGPAVNLASRITEAARPDSVLAEATAVEAAGDGFRYSRVGEHKFKGVKRPVKLYRVRRHQ